MLYMPWLALSMYSYQCYRIFHCTAILCKKTATFALYAMTSSLHVLLSVLQDIPLTAILYKNCPICSICTRISATGFTIAPPFYVKKKLHKNYALYALTSSLHVLLASSIFQNYNIVSFPIVIPQFWMFSI